MAETSGQTETTIRLRPTRIQRAAESEVERQIANVNRVMDLPDEERAEMEAAIRSLIEPPSIGGLTKERLAEALHAEQANREVGCGNHTESYDDHMEWHRGQAGRILRFLASHVAPTSVGDT